MSGQDLAILGGTPAVAQPRHFIWPPVTEEDINAVVRLMRNHELSYYGREGEVAELEDAFCDYLGIRHGLATRSGTTALHSAFFGAEIGPGDEVLAPTYTFLATVMPIFVTNGTPVLVDAEPDTGNIDPADIERRITPRTKALVVTHMWGQPCDMPAIVDIARRHDLILIEDCSHAHGAICNGQKVGTFGDVAVFSLQGKKLVAAGQGGILMTNNQDIYERATLLGHFKVRSHQEVRSEKYAPFASTGYGLNYRMHPLAAAIANVQFRKLEERIAARHHNFDYLSERLHGIPGIEPPVHKQYVTRHALYSYKPLYRPHELNDLPITLYIQALRAEGVDIEKSETPPLHLEPLFQVHNDQMETYGRPDKFVNGGTRRTYAAGDLPNSELYANRSLVLPAFTEPVRDMFDQYVIAFQKVAENIDRLHAYQRETERSPAVGR